MIGYKAFDKHLQCRGFQYEVGKEYEIDGKIEVCKCGFHACENPLEVFDHYDMLNSRFCKVEQTGDIDKEEQTTKICSSKIKIVAELKLSDMIRLGVEWLKEITSPSKVDVIKNDGGDYAQIGSSGNCDKIGSSGYYAQIGSSGDSAQIGSSGNYDKIGSSGYYAQIGSSGDYAQIGSSGNYAQIGSSGYYAQIGSSGNYDKIGSSGDYAQIGSSGDYAQIGSSGNYDKIGSSGDYAQIESTGENSVICCAGANSIVKAKKGSWVTLSEWIYDKKSNRDKPVCVKTEYVDGERIKEDTWYKLVNGEFTEVK